MGAALTRAAPGAIGRFHSERRRAPGVPAGYLPARVTTSSSIYSIADRRGEVRGDVRAGAEVWVEAKPSAGWRRIFVPGGGRGWIENEAVEPRLPPAPEAPRAPAKPDPRSPTSI